jgi:hypothetical protein
MTATFIVTSCINNAAGRGVFSHEERYEQTLDTFESIRLLAPNSKILFVDDSVQELPKQWKDEISKKCTASVYFEDETLLKLSKMGLQSPAECILLLETFKLLKSEKIQELKSDRIFKITGRCTLDDGFSLDRYSSIGDDFVFKKRVQSWMNSATYLLDTRLWSFGWNFLDKAISLYESIFPVLLKGFDLEHATFSCIPKENLIEFDRVFLKGRVASDGSWRYD